MKRKSVVMALIGLAIGGAFADNAFDYYSLTNHENWTRLNNPNGLQEPIPLPSKEFVDNNLFVMATNWTVNARTAGYIMRLIGRSVRKFPDAYNQQELEAYAFNCLTNTLSIPDSLEWTIVRGGNVMRKELLRGTFLAYDVVVTNRSAICYLADYIGSIPVIEIDRQRILREYDEAIALDKEQGYPDYKGPALKASAEKWRMLEWQAPLWRKCRAMYFDIIINGGLVPKWKGSFSPEDFSTIKSNFIERAHLTPEEAVSVFR